ncbi:hypothetical protein tb265_07780 [Gemmatimonadetes bacterium T265]|nr:hypothetical protein tb265_07780 [Gemmatimonadetes bacterium T265]
MHHSDVPADSPGAPPRGEPRPRRRVLVQSGVEWTVTECSGSQVPGARGTRCLIFASAEAIRRVWEVPPDWYILPDAALFALSWQR